jgi:hypothetical protein
MASNLPTIQRFYTEDYKEAPTWFLDKFIPTLNLYAAPVYAVLNGGIDIAGNTKEEIYQTSITAQGLTNSFTFTPKKFVGSPNGIEVGHCVPHTSVPTPNAGPVFVDWSSTGKGTINVLKMHNLTAGVTYDLTFRIY